MTLSGVIVPLGLFSIFYFEVCSLLLWTDILPFFCICLAHCNRLVSRQKSMISSYLFWNHIDIYNFIDRLVFIFIFILIMKLMYDDYWRINFSYDWIQFFCGQAIDLTSELVCIHDSARPLVSSGDVAKVWDADFFPCSHLAHWLLLSVDCTYLMVHWLSLCSALCSYVFLLDYGFGGYRPVLPMEFNM